MDYSKITGKELDELKDSFVNLFDRNIFPYKSGKVTFDLRKEFGQDRVMVYYRNRTGYLQADNGYYGPQPDGRNYYLVIHAHPYFTNVHSAYHGRAEGKECTWDTKMLDIIAKKLTPAWNNSIEEGHTLYR